MIDAGTKSKQNELLKKYRFVMHNQYCDPELAFTYWQDA